VPGLRAIDCSLALAVALGPLACSGGHTRPPFADDGLGAKSSTPRNSGPSIIVTKPEASGGGGCGQTVDLPVQRPNFYFVLDFSGSMNDIMPDSGGQTRLTASREAVHLMLREVGSKVNFGAALFPDPESDGCSAGKEIFPMRVGDEAQEAGEDSPALDGLMSALRRHSASGGTPVSPTLAALRGQLSELTGQTYVFLVTDGAPNCNLDVPCDSDMCIANIEGARFDDGTRCDDSLNCCTPDLFPDLCLDESGSTTELTKLSAIGIPSFIVGMPGSETYATTLERMADAAGTARKDSPRAYYGVKDAAGLAATLADLGRLVLAECELNLTVPAARREHVQLLADGDALSVESDWEWSSDASILLLGDTCDRWKAGEFQRIRLQETCRPDVL
jgi:hypothetical protein